jgi:hypothetical protein
MKTTTIKQGLSKLFNKNEQSNELSNTLIEKLLVDRNKIQNDSIGYVDDNRVFFICPKNEVIKGFIKNNFKADEMNSPKLDFKVEEKLKEKEIASKFSMKYLKSIIKMCEGYEWVQIKMKRNYPISIETDDFKCFLAPRVEPADE